MTITYTWKVTGLKTRTEGNNRNAVVQTYWQKIGTDGTHEGTFSGATPFTSTNMPEGDVFIPFEQLTEEIVLQWIKDVVSASPSYEAHINEKIQEEIDSKHSPIVDNPMPWAPPPQEPQATPNV